jgi:hypothetical protein
MPDPILILKARSAAAIVATVILLISAKTWAKAGPAWRGASAVAGAGLGFFVGCLILGMRPHWPPQEDQDRLLLIIIPAVIAVEVVAALSERFLVVGLVSSVDRGGGRGARSASQLNLSG